MKAETRVNYWKKYRANLEKANVDRVDANGYIPMHLYATTKEEVVILEKPKYEIEQRHKDFDLKIKKHNNKILTFKIVLASILVAGTFVFAYFAFFYKF